MRYLISLLLVALLILMFSFRGKKNDITVGQDVVTTTNFTEEKPVEKNNIEYVGTTIRPSEFVNYAKTLIGTPYLYGSVDPQKGLDCSGFINAVSNHFGIKVPRSSVEFTNFGKTIETGNAAPGDLILFTGTDTSKRVVGHIGIVTDNTNGQIQFIHSSSGKAMGVTISDMAGYYETRFVKIVRILPADKIVA